jgi:hypothetical protein
LPSGEGISVHGVVISIVNSPSSTLYSNSVRVPEETEVQQQSTDRSIPLVLFVHRIRLSALRPKHILHNGGNQFILCTGVWHLKNRDSERDTLSLRPGCDSQALHPTGRSLDQGLWSAVLPS